MSNDDDQNSVLSSLNDLSDMAGSGEKAKVKKKAKSKAKVKRQAWMSDDSADSLLAGILDETSAEAEAEQKRREEERKRKEEEERKRKEDEERKRREMGEQALAAERARAAELERQRQEMEAEIERQKLIEQGLLDPEEEERQRQAEEAAARAKEQEAQQKDEALEQAQRLIQEQQSALKNLTEASLKPVAPVEIEVPQKSNTGLIIGIIAVLLIGGGVGAFFLIQGQQQAPVDEAIVLEGGAQRDVRARTTEGEMAGVGYFTREGVTKTEIAKDSSSKKKRRSRSSRKRRKKKEKSSSSKKRKSNNTFDIGSGKSVGKGGSITF